MKTYYKFSTEGLKEAKEYNQFWMLETTLKVGVFTLVATTAFLAYQYALIIPFDKIAYKMLDL